MRAAIYARFSTDKQSDASVADQFRLCESRLPAGAKVVARYSDEAVSGSTPVLRRPGGRELMAAALTKQFDLLLVESLDRISRDQVDLETTVRRIERAGVRILGASDGYDSTAGGRKVLRTMRGLIGELYLDDLREKTHRGLTGRALAGFVAAGKCYGYRIERVDTGSKETSGSRYVIDPQQAEVVREILGRFAAGESVQKIAHDLNARGIPSPRGGTWAVSAIYGSPARGAGILNQSLYAGRMVWNRGRWVKDPDTGKRQRIDRPREEWIETDAPELRIVSDEVWQRVRARLDAGRDPVTRKKRAGRPARTIFGGLLRCPKCRGPMVAADKNYYGCAARKDRGPSVCEGFRARRKAVDAALFSLLRVLIERPEYEQQFKAAYAAEMEDDSDAKRRADRMRALDKQIGNLVAAIADMGGSEALTAKLAAAEAERVTLRAQQAAAPADVDAGMLWVVIKGHLRTVLAAGDSEVMRAGVANLLGPVLLQTNDAGETWADVVVRVAASAERSKDASNLVAGAGCVHWKHSLRVG